MRVKEQRALQQKEKTQALYQMAKDKAGIEHHMKAVHDLQAEKLQQSGAVRVRTKANKEEAEQNRERFLEQARQRVAELGRLDARLDAEENAEAQKRADVARRRHLDLQQQITTKNQASPTAISHLDCKP